MQPQPDLDTTPALFDATEALRAEPLARATGLGRRPPGVSAGTWRVMRQDAALRAGTHPLALATGFHIGLHPQAAPVEDRDAPGLRCGGCKWREVLGYGRRSYPKCMVPEPGTGQRLRWSHGPGTDVRRHWPGCPQWSAAGEANRP